jgi:RNA recognition motif-containing protein
MRPQKIQGNVFVANLPTGMSDEQLAELFDPFGMVLRAYLARDPATGETRGHGLVLLAPDKAADEAIASLNGTSLEGRRMDVRRADPEMSLTPPAPASRPPRVEAPRPPPRAVVVERLPPRSRSGGGRLGLAPSRNTRTLEL